MIKKVDLYGKYDVRVICDQQKPKPISIGFDERIKTTKRRGFRNSYDVEISATLKKENVVRFHEYDKKNLYKIAEIYFPKDEIVSVGDHFYYVNPTLDFDSRYVYFGAESVTGDWEVLALSYGDIFQREFVEKLKLLDAYPNFQALTGYGRVFTFEEKEKKFTFILECHSDQDYEYGQDEVTNVYENQEIENMLFSRNKEDVEKFVEIKKRAKEERESEKYLSGLKKIENEILNLYHSLSEDDNKEAISSLLTTFKELQNKEKTS